MDKAVEMPQLDRVFIGAGEYVDYGSAMAMVMALQTEINRLSAADDARAVGDEEVVLVMANNQSAWHGCDDTAARCASEDCGCKDDAQRLLKSLRAAGLKVVRG